MARMLNAIKIMFSGKGFLDKQLCLFSILGLLGLETGYLALWQENYVEISLLQKILFVAMIAIFELFCVGYEILFLHKRELPEINMEIFHVATKKIPLIVWGISLIFHVLGVFTRYTYFSTCALIILAIPLTIAIAGYSYDFSGEKVADVFKNIKLKDCLMLLLKRIWVVVVGYLFALAIVFVIGVTVGIIFGFQLKGDISAWTMLVSSHQQMIAKLGVFLMAIMLSYSMFCGMLAWDYELIKTYEDNVKEAVAE